VRRKWRDNRERKKKEDGPLLQGLGVEEAGVAEVVEAALREDLGASLEPGHVVGGLERLGDDAARGAEHDPASVDRC
jgi:hypothetical protein